MGFTPSHWLLSVSAECWGRNWRYGEIQFNLLLRLLAPPCKWNKWVTLWTTLHWMVILVLDCCLFVLNIMSFQLKHWLFCFWTLHDLICDAYCFISCVSEFEEKSSAHTVQVFRMEAVGWLHTGPLLPKEERPGAFVLGFLSQSCWPPPPGSIASFTCAALVDRNKLSGRYVYHFPC